MSAANNPQTPWQRLSAMTLPVATIRQVDQTAMDQYHMHSLVLMENAARSCVDWLVQRFPIDAPVPMETPVPVDTPRAQPFRIAILCGRGNNGGDGLAMARHLRLRGCQCQVLVAGPVHALSPDARANWQVLTARNQQDCFLVNDPVTSGSGKSAAKSVNWSSMISQADVIIDAMVGSGASGPPRPPFDDWIRVANASAGARIAIDIPTGVDGQSGAVAVNAFQAQATLTFVARKPGLDADEARSHVGEVAVMPIGIPNDMIEELLVSQASGQKSG